MMKKTLMVLCVCAAAFFAAAQNLSPEQAKKMAQELRAQAVNAYNAGRYQEASALADKALALFGTLALSKPAEYVVRDLPGNWDYLRKIAAYPFIYGDESKWPLIWRANPAAQKRSGNPDLIYPGEVLVIPSLSGETRSGRLNPEDPLPSGK